MRILNNLFSRLFKRQDDKSQMNLKAKEYAIMVLVGFAVILVVWRLLFA